MITEIVLCSFVIWFVFYLTQRPKNFPPGPRGYPFIGAIPILAKLDPTYPFIATLKLSYQYGPVVGFYGGFKPIVSVCGYEAVNEALHNEDLNGRPDNANLRDRNFGKRLGIFFLEGEIWKEQRRFTLRHLRDLGFGKTSLEGIMFEELNDLFQDINKHMDSNPHHIVDFKGFFNTSVVNILWAILAGQRSSRDDPKFKQLLTHVETIFRTGQPIRAVVPVPLLILKMFPPLQRFLGQNIGIFKPFHKFIMEIVEEHIKNPADDNPRDFIDVFLREMSANKDKPNNTFTKEQLIVTVMDVFAAGAESTSNSIGFTLLHLIHHPEAQKKMQAELDAVCGDSLPTLMQRTKLPYTEAVLAESQRISNIAPFAAPHEAMKDTHLQGYTIPKGSLIQINLHSVHTDEKTWPDPYSFQPERHLDSQGKFVKSNHFFPFGAGRRSCLGEPLARNTFYLFVAGLVKNFEFSSVPGEPLPDLTPINGITLGYKGFSAVVTPRV